MNFLIRFSFNGFVKGLASGSTVYSVSFTETDQETKGSILLTSDAGIAGGAIHAYRLNVDPAGEDPLAATGQISLKLDELLKLKGMVCELGVLLTEGLHDAIRVYGKVRPVALKNVNDWIAREKGENK